MDKVRQDRLMAELRRLLRLYKQAELEADRTIVAKMAMQVVQDLCGADLVRDAAEIRAALRNAEVQS